MALRDYFAKTTTQSELPNLTIGKYPCWTNRDCESLVERLYSKVLHEAADRASLPEGVEKDGFTITIYNSYSPYREGLISLVAEAMTYKKQQFYRVEKVPNHNSAYSFTEVFGDDAKDESGNVKPDILELDFRKFCEADLLRILAHLLRTIMAATASDIFIGQSVLFKLQGLAEMINNEQNLEALQKQLTVLNESILSGKTGYIDDESEVTRPMINTDPNKEAMAFIFNMMSLVTGVPSSVLWSEVVGGLGDNSNSEMIRYNQALKHYFHSVLSGVFYAVYNRVFHYKKMVSDLDGMISVFSFIETTTLLSDEGKKRLLLDNTNLDEDDLNLGEPSATDGSDRQLRGSGSTDTGE